jgi:hypothetical protein
MVNIKEKSLIKCLAALDLRDLPKEWDKENVWILAVGLISKIDGTFSYAALKKDKDGNARVVKDFGNICAIRQVEKVYPYKYLDATFVPYFKGRSKDERIAWLEQMGEEGNFGEMSAKELDKKVLNVAIQQALKALNDN